MRCGSNKANYCFIILLVTIYYAVPFLAILIGWYILLWFLKFKPFNYLTILFLLLIVIVYFYGFFSDVYEQRNDASFSIEGAIPYFSVILFVTLILVGFMYGFYKQIPVNVTTFTNRNRLNRPQN